MAVLFTIARDGAADAGGVAVATALPAPLEVWRSGVVGLAAEAEAEAAAAATAAAMAEEEEDGVAEEASTEVAKSRRS